MPITNNGSKFVTHITDLDSTNKTNLYTVPANFSSHLENLMVSNNHTGNITLSLFLFTALDTTEHTILTTFNVAGGSYESIFTVERPMFLHAGDIIKATAGTADKLQVLIAAEEHFDPAR
jgi:hypothetical protein